MKGISFFVRIAATALVPAGLFAQALSATSASADASVVVVKGAKTPNLIPDRVAWRVFFCSIAEPDNPSPPQVARFRAKLRAVGLTADDESSLLSLMADFHRQYGPRKAAQGEAGVDQLVNDTKSVFASRLSSFGLERLSSHVVNLKSKMRMVSVVRQPTE